MPGAGCWLGAARLGGIQHCPGEHLYDMLADIANKTGMQLGTGGYKAVP